MTVEVAIGGVAAFLAGWAFKLVFEQLSQIRQNTRELYSLVNQVEHKVKDEKIERLESIIKLMERK